MGSDSDFPVVKGALTQLKKFGVPFEARVLSAHRTPAQAEEFAKNAEKNGFGVIIAAAGMAAHLASSPSGRRAGSNDHAARHRPSHQILVL